MKGVLILLLFWPLYSAEGNADLYQAYYNESFYSYVVRTHNISNYFVKELFSNLISHNTTNNCVQDLKQFQDSIKSQEKWAISLLDSSGVPMTGLLTGNTINLGNYKQCLSTSSKNFNSSYCLVHLKISNNSFFSYIPHNVPILFTLCVPDTCSGQQLQTILTSSDTTNNATATFAVECQQRRPGFTIGDIFALCLYILIWIVIISTTIPTKWIPVNNGAFHQIWSSFNLQNNLASLLRTNKKCTLLSSLNGLRVLCQFLVIWLHVVALTMFVKYPAMNKFSSYEFYRSWGGTLETAIYLVLETFLVLGGILLSWNFLEKKRQFNLFTYYAHRYFRLMPPYLATILMIATFSNKLCDGPLCTYFIDGDKQSCESYWWTNVIFINNVYPGIFDSCMKHSWYLALEWQLFFFVSPFVLIVLKKWPHHFYKLVAGILLTSMISTFLVSYLYHIPTDNFLFDSEEEFYNYFQKMYVLPFMRAGPWIIGMYFGVVLHNFKSNPKKLSKKVYLIGWAISILVICLCIGLIWPFLIMRPNGVGVWSALFNTIQHNLFAVSICWIIFCSGTQKAGFIGSFLCWPFFQPLAKVSYSTFLIHLTIVNIYYGETYSSGYLSATTKVTLVLGISVLSYVSGLLLYLSFEAPAAHIENIIFKKEVPGNQTRKIIGEDNTPQEITTMKKDKIQGLESVVEK